MLKKFVKTTFPDWQERSLRVLHRAQLSRCAKDAGHVGDGHHAELDVSLIVRDVARAHCSTRTTDSSSGPHSSMTRLRDSAFVPVATFVAAERSRSQATAGTSFDCLTSTAQSCSTRRRSRRFAIRMRLASRSCARRVQEDSRQSGGLLGERRSSRRFCRSHQCCRRCRRAREGLATGDNDSFLAALVGSVDCEYRFGMPQSRRSCESSRGEWFPYNKGGAFRKMVWQSTSTS